jgi:hypothetical protein
MEVRKSDFFKATAGVFAVEVEPDSLACINYNLAWFIPTINGNCYLLNALL